MLFKKSLAEKITTYNDSYGHVLHNNKYLTLKYSAWQRIDDIYPVL